MSYLTLDQTSGNNTQCLYAVCNPTCWCDNSSNTKENYNHPKLGIIESKNNQLVVKNNQGQVYHTKHFDICPTSHQNAQKYHNMKKYQKLYQYVEMEDQFLRLEKDAVRFNSHLKKMMENVHKSMKKFFYEINFNYHKKHLQQGTQPHKKINPIVWKSIGKI